MNNRRTPRLLTGLPILLVGALALASCGSESADSSTAEGTSTTSAAATADEEVLGGTGETVAIDIADFEFSPATPTVAAGTTVQWTNQDSAEHSVDDRSDLGVETSPNMTEGDTFEITYDAPGTYAYVCGIHNFMAGEITVQ